MSEVKSIKSHPRLKPVPKITAAREARFWSMIALGGLEECWNWLHSRKTAGYGKLSFRRSDFGAHRIAFFLTHGRAPVDLCVCHSCDNKLCCNPCHLFLGTFQDNNADFNRKGLHVKGEKVKTAKLTEEMVKMARKMRKEGIASRNIALIFGVSKTTICEAISGRQWKHIND